MTAQGAGLEERRDRVGVRRRGAMGMEDEHEGKDGDPGIRIEAKCAPEV